MLEAPDSAHRVRIVAGALGVLRRRAPLPRALSELALDRVELLHHVARASACGFGVALKVPSGSSVTRSVSSSSRPWRRRPRDELLARERELAQRALVDLAVLRHDRRAALDRLAEPRRHEREAHERVVRARAGSPRRAGRRASELSLPMIAFWTTFESSSRTTRSNEFSCASCALAGEVQQDEQREVDRGGADRLLARARCRDGRGGGSPAPGSLCEPAHLPVRDRDARDRDDDERRRRPRARACPYAACPRPQLANASVTRMPPIRPPMWPPIEMSAEREARARG